MKIEFKDVTFQYYSEEKPVFEHLSFTIEQGTTTAILGHNGSGKSTIAKLIVGLLVPNAGQILIDDVELTEQTIDEIRKRMGIIFQNPDNQFVGVTVRDDIAFGLENICIPRNEMNQLIETYAAKVRMEKFLDHEPTKLSGGQKQRVAIAGILAMAPSIIILDEATSMLDPRGRHEINELVKEIKNDREMTIISITHDIEEAKNADRIILLNEGKIVRIGTPNEILTQADILNELKLDMPFALKISQQLRNKGIKVKETLNIEELEKQLCQLNVKI